MRFPIPPDAPPFRNVMRIAPAVFANPLARGARCCVAGKTMGRSQSGHIVPDDMGPGKPFQVKAAFVAIDRSPPVTQGTHQKLCGLVARSSMDPYGRRLVPQLIGMFEAPAMPNP